MEKKAKDIDLDGRVYDFVLRVTKLVRFLPKETAGREMGKQLLRAATSIAATIEEARGAFSRSDFTFKMNTAFKETRESNLWLRLTCDSGLVSSDRMAGLIRESEEIRNILGASVRTAKKEAKRPE